MQELRKFPFYINLLKYEWLVACDKFYNINIFLVHNYAISFFIICLLDRIKIVRKFIDADHFSTLETLVRVEVSFSNCSLVSSGDSLTCEAN